MVEPDVFYVLNKKQLPRSAVPRVCMMETGEAGIAGSCVVGTGPGARGH